MFWHTEVKLDITYRVRYTDSDSGNENDLLVIFIPVVNRPGDCDPGNDQHADHHHPERRRLILAKRTG